MTQTDPSSESRFSKQIFLGFLSSVLIAVTILAGARLIANLEWLHVLIITTLSLILSGALMAHLLSKALHEPLRHLNQQLGGMQEKVSVTSQELSAQAESSKALINDLPIGVLIFNRNLELIRLNQKARQLIGASEEINRDDLSKLIIERLEQLRGAIEPINFLEWLEKAKDSKIQDVKRWPMAVSKHADHLAAYDLVVRYNRQDSHGYELVILMIDRLEEYESQEKQMEFISLAAHELRGPITIMRGLIEVFQQELGDKLDEDHSELLSRMSISGRQLAGYIDNILNASRIDHETFAIKPVETDWPKLLNTLLEDVRLRAKARNRNLEVHADSGLPTVSVDATAISHVVNNLVDNAIKYSRDGGRIVINVHLKDGLVETTVQDFGVGIPANVVNNLFTKFYRSHKSKQIVSGTGLGLFLCKAITEAHGGNIWVRSSEGRGSTFGFTLPNYKDAKKQADNPDESGIIRGSHGWIKNHSMYRR